MKLLPLILWSLLLCLVLSYTVNIPILHIMTLLLIILEMENVFMCLQIHHWTMEIHFLLIMVLSWEIWHVTRPKLCVNSWPEQEDPVYQIALLFMRLMKFFRLCLNQFMIPHILIMKWWILLDLLSMRLKMIVHILFMKKTDVDLL